MRSESQFQKQCIDYLRSKGCYVYKNPQNQYTEKGRPDLTVCVPVKIHHKSGGIFTIGLYMGIELKREDKYNNASTAQEIVGRQIAKSHGLWHVIDSLDELKSIIEGWINVIH